MEVIARGTALLLGLGREVALAVDESEGASS